MANVLAAEPLVIARCISAWPAVAFVLVVEVITRGGRGHADHATPSPDTNPAALPDAQSDTDAPAQSTVAEPSEPSTPKRAASTTPRKKPTTSVRRPIRQTRELAANLRAEFPTITQAELARKLGISATRLRQIDRTEPSAERAQPVNGAEVYELDEVSA
jgi:hypothetical protein